MTEKIKLQELGYGAIYLGKMKMYDAAVLAEKLLRSSGIPVTSKDREYYLHNASAASNERFVGLEIDRYLRHYFNKPGEPWTVSDNAGNNVTTVYSVTSVEIPKSKTLEGYIPNTYYVYRVGGSAPKVGHETYDDAKEEINRIRKEDSSAKLADFIIFKCAGINYAEVEYKEIKGE